MLDSVTGERQWVRAKALPLELQLEVRGLAGSHPLRRAGGNHRGPLLAAAILVGTACAVFGVLVASKLPGGPMDNLLRTVPILAGGGLLGAWLGWLLVGSVRPEQGPVMLLGPTAVIIVEDVGVEILPAENLMIENGRLVADKPIADAQLESDWATRAATTIARARDPEQRVADPWRQVATASGQDARLSLSLAKPLLGLVAGLAVAFLLNQSLGATGIELDKRRWRAADDERRANGRVVERLARLAYGGVDHATASADTAWELLALYEVRSEMDLPAHVTSAMDQKLLALTEAELGAATTHRDARQLLLAVARAPAVPARVTTLAREFHAAHLAEIAAIDSLAEYPIGYVELADALGDPAQQAEARRKLAVLVRRDLADARVPDDIAPDYILEATRLNLGEQYKASLRHVYGNMARHIARRGSLDEVRAVMLTTTSTEATWLADPSLLDALRTRYVATAGPHIDALPLLEEIDAMVAEATSFGVDATAIEALRARRLGAARSRIALARNAEELDYVISLWPGDDDPDLADVVARAARARVDALIAAGAQGTELRALSRLRDRFDTTSSP